jgi:hypothetical protein
MTTNVLLLLAMPEKVRMQYFNGIREKFPELKLDEIGRASCRERVLTSV